MNEHVYRKRITNAAGAGTNLDDMVSKNVLAQLKRDPPARPDGPSKPAVESTDLLASMAKRLAMLERQMKERQILLVQIQEENMGLKVKLKAAENEIARRALAALSPPVPSTGAADASIEGAVEAVQEPTYVAYLRQENTRLRGQLRYAWKQVTDMKAYLNDYNLVWVGDPECEVGAHEWDLEELQGIPVARPSGSGVEAPSGHAVPAPRPSPSVRQLAGPAASSSNVELRASSSAIPGMGQGHILGGRPRSRGPRLSCPGNESLLDAISPPVHHAGATASDAAAAHPLPVKRPSGTLSQLPIPPRPPNGEPPHAPNLARQNSIGRSGPGSPTECSAMPHTHAHSHAQAPPSVPFNSAPPTGEASAPLSQAAAAPAATPSSAAASPSPLPAVQAAVALAPLMRRSSDRFGSSPLPPTSHAPSTAGSGSHAGSSSSTSNAAKDKMPFTLALLHEKVQELNQLAGDGEGRLVAGAAGHVLAMPEPVCLSVFRNGIQLHTQAARGFSDPSSKSILSDVMDGYFPSVLQREFPDGIPIRVVDRTSESYEAALAGAGAHGPGSPFNVRSLNEVLGSHSNASAGVPLSKAQFLSKLPHQVIRNGKVIEIRGQIGKIMDGGSAAGKAGESDAKPSVAVVASPSVDTLLSTMQRAHAGPALPPPSREGSRPPAEEIATLQVRSEDGKQTFIVKLKYDDTVGMMRKCIDQHRAAHVGSSTGGSAAACTGYEIRTAYPAKSYSEPHETLRQAGLVPNATLFLRALSS